MRVAVVRPPSIAQRFALTLDVTPPISVAYVAAAAERAGHEVTVVDAVGEGIGRSWPAYRPSLVGSGLTVDEIVARVAPETQVVGLSCMFSHEWPIVREIARRVARERPGARIVLGGEHPSAAPDACFRDVPEIVACVLGEGEETFVELLDALSKSRALDEVAGLAIVERGVVKRTAPRARIRDVDDLPTPAWHLVPIERYLDGGFSFGVDRGRTMPILATRGCPYRCTFCSSPQMWTTRYTLRSPERVVDEIEGYVERYGAESIDFYDLTAIVKPSWIERFCKLLLERDLGVTWQLPSGTRSEALAGGVLELLYASGCRNVSYAPESGSPATLRRIQKQVRLDRMIDSMRAAVDAGLNVKANLLIGFPDEDHASVRESLAFVVEMARAGVHDVSIWTFSPYPGSELFDELRRRGRIGELDDDFYASLLSYSDLAHAISYDDKLPSAVLQAYRLFGLGLFYATSFASHPRRVGETARRLADGEFESRSEMSLANLASRLGLRARARRGRAAARST